MLDVDDTQGFGPENITVTDGAPGRYAVFVQFFSGDLDPPPILVRVDLTIPPNFPQTFVTVADPGNAEITGPDPTGDLLQAAAQSIFNVATFTLGPAAGIGPAITPQEAAQVPSFPDLRGEFEGTGSLTLSGCVDAEDDGASPVSGRIHISDQRGATFFGNAGFVESDGVSVADITGAVAEDGSFSGTFTEEFFADVDLVESRSEGTFSGNLRGDTLTVAASGQDVFGDTCSIVGCSEPHRFDAGRAPGAPQTSPAGGSRPQSG